MEMSAEQWLELDAEAEHDCHAPWVATTFTVSPACSPVPMVVGSMAKKSSGPVGSFCTKKPGPSAAPAPALAKSAFT